MRKPTIEEYWNDLTRVLPELPAAQQRTAVALYRELAKGRALTTAELALAFGSPEQTVAKQLAQEPLSTFIYFDDARIAGFGGLATAPMHHEFVVHGNRLWTWCAWDSLFIPSLLDAAADVASPDPHSGATVRLRVSPRGIEHIDPASALVSFLAAEAHSFSGDASNVMASFCHHVFFLASAESGERWREKHAGLLFYSPHEAFELGQRLVARQFGDAL